MKTNIAHLLLHVTCVNVFSVASHAGKQRKSLLLVINILNLSLKMFLKVLEETRCYLYVV
jgi:hypothetical protein